MADEQSNSDSNYDNSNLNSNETDEPIYVMTLELEKGRAEQIKIYADSDANELAYAFCKEHDLDFSALEYLKERIEALLSQIKERTESQGSQIEEVDDEHINTEDNQLSQLNSLKEGMTDENGLESEKESQLKPKQRLKASSKSEKGEKDNHNAVSIENEANDRQISNEANEETKVKKEIDTKAEMEERKSREEKDDESPFIQKEEKNKDEGEDNQINEKEEKKQISQEENQLNALDDNSNKEDIAELEPIDDKSLNDNAYRNEQTSLKDNPFEDQGYQHQLELENEIDSKDHNETPPDNQNGPKKELIYNKAKPIATKAPLFSNSKAQEALTSTGKAQIAPLSSPNHNKTKQHKNYFREQKPIFSQNVQSTQNAKLTQTEQKSTSHSPLQSKTTNPTINNHYTLKPLVLTPSNQKITEPIPQTSSPLEKGKEEDEVDEAASAEAEEEKVPFQSHGNNLHKYNSHWSKRQLSSNTNIFDRLFREAEMKRILPYHSYNHSCSSNNHLVINDKKTIYSTIKTKPDIDKPSHMNYGEYLYSKDKMMKEEKEKQISQIKEYQAQQERYPFKPSIASSDSRLNVNPSKKRIDKMERMKKELSEVYTFKPKINRNYNTELSFNDRQHFFANLYKQHNHELNQVINSNLDEKGNLLFHPQLIAKQTEVNTTEINCFDKNYNYAMQYRKNKEELSHKLYDDKRVGAYRNSQTEKIVISLHREAFGMLFRELNSDRDGQLNALNLTTKTTPKEILGIISPLLFELKEDNHSLREDEFISAMSQLFKELTVVEQRTLINAYKKQSNRSKSKELLRNERNGHSYKPMINSNTSKLAMRYDTKIAERYPGIIGKKESNVNRCDYFKSEPKKTLETVQTFSSIHNYTFDNYAKKII